jgi:hypothetical protein
MAVVVLLKKRQRQGEEDRMDDYFCMAPSHKILAAKNDAKTLHVATGGRRYR